MILPVERVGINIDDCRITDNEGNQPIDEPVFADGDAAYFSNLPIKAMVNEIRKNKIPASISNSAGTFVCNHVLYGVRYMIEKEFAGQEKADLSIFRIFHSRWWTSRDSRAWRWRLSLRG